MLLCHFMTSSTEPVIFSSKLTQTRLWVEPTHQYKLQCCSYATYLYAMHSPSNTVLWVGIDDKDKNCKEQNVYTDSGSNDHSDVSGVQVCKIQW